MKHIVVLIGSVVLAACGGGGSGTTGALTPSSQVAALGFDCVVPQLVSQDRYRIALIDAPRDHGSLTLDGINATGLVNVARQLDRIKCVGFDTVSFQTFIPIDPATGLLKEFDPAGLPGDQDKRLPPDYWRWVDYAKSIGLRVVLQAVPANYKNDQQLYDKPYPNLPVNTVLETIKAYYVNMAREAQRRGVEAMHIGHFQNGFDTSQYASKWQEVVSSVKTVYSGKTIYATCSQCTANVVWGMVDIVSAQLTPTVRSGCSATVDQIRASYAASVQRLISLKNTYSKMLWIDQVSIDLIGCQLPAGVQSLYQLLFNNQSINFSVSPVDHQWQLRSFHAVFDLISSDLITSVSGIGIAGYLPWTEAAWIQNPQNYTQWLYKKYDTLGSSLYRNTQIQMTLQEYFRHPWGHRLSH